MKLAVDLYSGTGQATSAFRADPEWTVIAVDLVGHLNSDPAIGFQQPDLVADCRRLPIAGRVDFLWASPPCTEFSQANPSRPAAPSIEHFIAVFDAVRRLKPKFWILENVRGAIPFLGIPVQKIGPWCLWGYFPPIRVNGELHCYRKSRFRSAVARATVPLSLSAAVHRSVTLWWKNDRLLDQREIRPYRHFAPGNAVPLRSQLPLPGGA